jgi:hypothetical protein
MSLPQKGTNLEICGILNELRRDWIVDIPKSYSDPIWIAGLSRIYTKIGVADRWRKSDDRLRRIKSGKWEIGIGKLITLKIRYVVSWKLRDAIYWAVSLLAILFIPASEARKPIWKVEAAT